MLKITARLRAAKNPIRERAFRREIISDLMIATLKFPRLIER